MSGQPSSRLEYRPAANLVIESARARGVAEPTGEAQTLVGRLAPKGMGDRAHGARPAELEDKLAKARKRRERAALERDDDALVQKRRRATGAAGAGAGGFLATLSNAESGGYRPRTKESRAAYDEVLTIVQRALGDGISADTLTDAAEEVLAITRADAVETAKATALAKLFGAPLNEATLFRMLTLSKSCNDFGESAVGEPTAVGGGDGGAGGGASSGIAAGVAVVIDEDEDEVERDAEVFELDDDEPADDDAMEDGTLPSSSHVVHKEGTGGLSASGALAATRGSAPSTEEEIAAGLIPCVWWLRRVCC